MAQDNNSKNNNSIDSMADSDEKMEELRAKHADILNNPAVMAVAYWRDPLEYIPKDEKTMSNEELMSKAKENLPILLDLYNKAIALHTGQYKI